MKIRQLPLLLIALALLGFAAWLTTRGPERDISDLGGVEVPAEPGPRSSLGPDLAEPPKSPPAESAPNRMPGEFEPTERDPAASQRRVAGLEAVELRFTTFSESEEGEAFGIGDVSLQWTLIDEEGVQVAAGATSSDEAGRGSFLLELPPNLEALALQLSARKQGWLQEDSRVIQAWNTESLKDELEDPVEIFLSRGVWLRGTVYDPDGSLCESGEVLAQLHSRDPDDDYAVDASIEEGRFTVALNDAGTWSLSASAKDVGTALVENLVVSMERDPPALELQLRGSGSLSGVVLGADQKPIYGVEVYAVLASALDDQGHERFSLTAYQVAHSEPKRGAFGTRRAKSSSDHEGRFEFNGLEPGRYALACVQPAGDRYAASEVVFAETNGAPAELTIGLCLLTVHLEVSPGPASLEYEPGLQRFTIDCTRFDPIAEGPATVGSNRFGVHRAREQIREAQFLVIPGHLYEVHAAPSTPPFPIGRVIFIQGTIQPREPNPVEWTGLEARQQIAIPRGRGKQSVTLTIPAPRPPGVLELQPRDEESELPITWSLSLFADAQELITNHELWNKFVSLDDLPLSLPLQPGSYQLRVHSSHQLGSPRLFAESSISARIRPPWRSAILICLALSSPTAVS